MGIWKHLTVFPNCFCRFKGRPLSVQQQMMQQSRQLDPNLLVKQQTPPSQQQSLHQPAMKSFLENVLPHTTPELQKGPSPVNAFSNFPIGGFLLGHTVSWCVEIPDLAGLFPCEDNTGPLAVPFCGCSLHASGNMLHALSSKKPHCFKNTTFIFEWVRIKMIIFLLRPSGI